MNLPHVTVILNWRKEVNSSGLYSVYLRITLNRISRYYKVDTPQKVRQDQWSGIPDSWVKNSHPFAFEINNKILEKKAVITELTKRCYNFKKSITFENIFSHLKQKGDKNSFYDFMDAYIKRPPEKLEPNTIKKYSTTLTHLRSFRKELFFPVSRSAYHVKKSRTMDSSVRSSKICMLSSLCCIHLSSSSSSSSEIVSWMNWLIRYAALKFCSSSAWYGTEAFIQ